MKKIIFSDLILFENDQYIIINKPPFISSLEDRNDTTNILELARENNPDIQVCHRLDKNTSGCMVLSKTNDFYKYMAILFQNKEVKKKYHAVIEGERTFDSRIIDAPIYVKGGGGARIDYRRGKISTTKISTLETFRNYSLVECLPETGRMHQIRVHLSHIQAPIAGDTIYGGKHVFLSEIKHGYKPNQRKEELPIIRRYALHASSIEFIDNSGKLCNFEAPYPKDFRILLQQLRKFC